MTIRTVKKFKKERTPWMTPVIQSQKIREDWMLARISHHISAASANSASSGVAREVGHAQHTAKYASHGLGRLPRIQGRLDALATKSDEKCGPGELFLLKNFF
ncbi:MAG: hypothetical protein HYS08_01760 [Chlamydiae bacterium]|nr:hypothetical protein [Chlamydiota bacterium]